VIEDEIASILKETRLSCVFFITIWNLIYFKKKVSAILF